MKKYKYALFDWDGTLADTLSNAKRIFYKLAKDQGVELTEESLIGMFGDWEKCMQALRFANVEELKQKYSTEVESSLDQVGFNTNAIELLKDLYNRKVPIGIVTTSSRTWIELQAKAQRVIQYLDKIVGFEDATRMKPDPEPIENMLLLLNASKEESIMIGDTEKDIIAAANAGIDSILYSTEASRQFYGELDFEGYQPTYTVKDLIETIEFF